MKLWSINAASEETGRDERFLAKVLAHVPSDGRLNTHPAWSLKTILTAIARHERGGTPDEASINELESIGAELSGNLKKLAAIQSVAERRKFVEGGAFRKLGQFADGLEAAARDDADRMIMKTFVDHQIAGPIIGEMLRLCEWRHDPTP
jgi:hypothetical protein